ncbi:hypothetical protein MPTK1_5g02690 [Marchantia polymorpha subsp. ruderalis]|uniref:Uncharacterized protein n=2 Tax=Marchantia polymorpha TaxID=3197 RepID=A0AAF6BE96_MARPO|nr:hypothetical protein MARPO_0124s0054 [Marchantia polymorpha]BBN10330.1 hypothetical protein Mp_5g02690 [Marchantia polymorpha subsp. ruderalis]|eukprot:PTQ30488.1 hypothetical protein MARPO_0124s0054 [Marchantia polymorpha]
MLDAACLPACLQVKRNLIISLSAAPEDDSGGGRMVSFFSRVLEKGDCVALIDSVVQKSHRRDVHLGTWTPYWIEMYPSVAVDKYLASDISLVPSMNPALLLTSEGFPQ